MALRQFYNPANPLAHYETTGPEIYRDLDGRIDYFVAGAGSGGTYSGVVRYLKEQHPNVKGILADPVGSPFYTAGLEGTPNEVKIKYLADNDYADLQGNELKEAIKQTIRKKDSDLKGRMISEGTTPRKLTDLIGSLCDLTSGSGDKGTPIVLVQGYFDNYTDE